MGLAYLPDGSLIDYNDYINHPHWQAVRKKRLDFDDGKCVICHAEVRGKLYHTHHLNYQNLGHEAIRDVITLCVPCHKKFHQHWNRSYFWKGKEDGHWDVYDLDHTARLCAHYWKRDRLINKDPNSPNLCNRDVCRQLLDEYFRDFQIDRPPIIDPNDIQLFVRNKRYELFFDAEIRGLTVDEFLEEYYGPKIRGKNPLRQEAGKKGGPFDHTPESFHRHYEENKNIITLMGKVREIEEYKEG